MGRYGGNRFELVPSLTKAKNFSGVWKNITSVMLPTNKYYMMFKTNTGFVLGDGSRIKFWDDEWVISVILKFQFSRIYNLAINKNRWVSEFGGWRDNVWEWNTLLRKNLMSWEQQQWNDLLSILKNQCMSNKLADALIWKDSSDGKYKSNRFCKKVGYAPPKVEVMCWQAMRGGLAVKDQLVFLEDMDSLHEDVGTRRDCGVLRDEQAKCLIGHNHGLIVECDSSNAVTWVVNPNKAPWRYRNVINLIENLKMKISRWEVRHILRECNQIADGLAKTGVSRVNDFLLFNGAF
ncbi:hypothetical protein DITRI_Ditri17bG0094100 [Diplodiscus trichospermus]